jgi:hypothetical protein
MRVDTQFSIFLINKPGVLAQVTSALARSRVNIVALSLSDSGEHGVLRVLPDDTEKTRQVLGTTHDRWTETDVLALELQNEPGAFAAAAECLAVNHVNISYAYCTGGAKGGKSTAVFKVADMNKAKKALSEMLNKGGKGKSGKPVRPNPSRKRS